MAAVSVTGIVAGGMLEVGMSVPFSQWLFIAACALLPSVGLLISGQAPRQPLRLAAAGHRPPVSASAASAWVS